MRCQHAPLSSWHEPVVEHSTSGEEQAMSCMKGGTRKACDSIRTQTERYDEASKISKCNACVSE